jgi:hypothetical protein
VDFTLKTYRSLLKALLKQTYVFQTFQEYLEKPKSNSIILRHDVDKFPKNSLRFAQIQQELGIKGSYYFRIVPESFNVKKIKEINSKWLKSQHCPQPPESSSGQALKGRASL